MARRSQRGLTLIEVLVVLVVVSLGLLSAAKLQWRALQGTDSALKGSQIAWLSQSMLEQSRSAAGIGAAELLAFQRNVETLVGPEGRGEVRQGIARTRVSVSWSDERAGGGWRVHDLEGAR